jgi:pimeloyl-ACP methyl ester carboxylesterase
MIRADDAGSRAGRGEILRHDMADDLRQVATNVMGGVVPDSGHWIMEENPAATRKLIVDFLK